MLKESGMGLSSGSSDFDSSPGFGFKMETYKTGMQGREGSIQEQNIIFGKKYSYNFDYGTIRKKLEELAKEEGFEFSYQITSLGL